MERVLGAVFEVSNTLGSGFLEKVYARALVTELGLRGLHATPQASFKVTYKGRCVGADACPFKNPCRSSNEMAHTGRGES